jgi:hypothetical protein
MTGILKVDTIQKNNGATPTAADLGLNISGSILQVVSAQHPNTATSTGSPYVDYATIQITPRFATSKIYISHVVSYGGVDNSYAAGRCQRNGVSLRSGNSPYTEGRFTDASFGMQMNANANDQYKIWNTHWQYLDSPNTTSTLTYVFAVRTDNSTRQVTVNYSQTNPSDGYNPPPWTSTTLFEVAA